MITVRNIWAIGRNYSEHARELGNETPDRPVVFLKSGSCIQASDSELVFPMWLKNIHHEIEIGLLLNSKLDVDSYCLAIDFTERDIQEELKEKKYPWTLAKSFPGACAVTKPRPITSVNDLDNLRFSLSVNQVLRQQGTPSQMLFSMTKLINYLQKYFPLCPGDLILTGTPAGVSQIHSGDRIDVEDSLGTKHTWTVHQPQMRPK